MMNSPILKQVTVALIPFVQVFGIYIIFHGHLSPGGGFAGGTVLGVSLILYRMVLGKAVAQKHLRSQALLTLIVVGVMVYGIMKGYSFISGGSHLHWPMPPLGQLGDLLSGGFLLPLNIAVGTIVAISMYFFYGLFEDGDI